jgi:membrane protein YqaA with SNARE-associated domain
MCGTGTAVAFLWGFAESTLFFILPDVMLSFVALYRPRRALVLMLAMLMGAVLGGSVMYVWATHGQGAHYAVARVPAVSPKMFERAEQDWERYGPWGMSLGPVRGIPYKVYAVETPAKSSLLGFALFSIPARLWRFVAVWLGFSGAGLLLRKMGRASLVPLVHAVFWVVTYAVYWTNV